MAGRYLTAEDFQTAARTHLRSALAKVADEADDALTTDEIAALAYERSRNNEF